MRPEELRRRALAEARGYLKLPRHVFNDLLGQLRRQDPEHYRLLRSCLAELRQERPRDP